ncbi:MAG: tyrosine-type recombinase/integrase [Candidatus Peribacteraceae bacterium]|nr:tyrosine-type recombinase/integrase [Candidatus Peribacteraceae bacterium]
MSINDKLLKEFVKDVEIRGWTEPTIQSCHVSLGIFFDCIDKDCREADLDDLKVFLRVMQKRPGRNGKLSLESIRKHVNNLASFYEYLEFEDIIVKSPVPKFRRRYLNPLLKKYKSPTRQLISIEDMARLINSVLDPQEKAIMCVLAKTGVRVSELTAMDFRDVDMTNYSIKLKQTGKRSVQNVYFDNECAKCLRRWFGIREDIAVKGEKALFVTPNRGTRTTKEAVNYMVKKHSKRAGLHDDDNLDLSVRLTPHCFRHWFTTHLRRAGMPREYIKELRGDIRGDTMDIYDHIDESELKKSYLECVPQLGL